MLADLDAELASRMQMQPWNVFAWLPLMYWRAMLNGRGKPAHRYPDIRPIGVRTYARRMAAEMPHVSTQPPSEPNP